MIVAFSISPAAGDETGGVSDAVAEAVRVVRASGLPNETNAMFTNLEGEWDEVMAVVKQAVDAVAAVSPRVSLVLKADIRPGYTGQLTAKVERMRRKWTRLTRISSASGLSSRSCTASSAYSSRGIQLGSGVPLSRPVWTAGGTSSTTWSLPVSWWRRLWV